MSVGQLYSPINRGLPLLAAVLPLLTINACYLVAIGLDHLPACVPYFSGCTPVSSIGRLAPESLIFRVGMLPSAVIVALFWWRCSTFLQICHQSGIRLVTLRLLGVIAALSLVHFTLILGFPGSEYRFLRRIAINGFAVSNFVAQLLFIVCYRRMEVGVHKNLLRALVTTCAALPILAIAAEVAKFAGAPRYTTNNIVAWNAFVLLCTWFALQYFLWRHHQFDNTSSGRAISPRA